MSGKEVATANLKYYSDIYLEEPSLQAEISTQDYVNTKMNCY
jgi:hypothetical protein